MQKQKIDQPVSVIITTKNEAAVIGRLLRSVKNQTYKNIEIILVDNDSSDKTLEIAKKEKIKIYKYGTERSSQRNYGAKQSKGKYLLFLDADMKLSKNVISECVKLAENDISVGGVIIPEKSVASKFWEKVKAFERSFYNQTGDEITDAVRFFRKTVFIKFGGYDENITGSEDWDLTDRIRNKGYIIGRIHPVIYHRERITSLFYLAKKKFYYALTLHRYLKKQGISPISQKTVYLLRPVFYRRIDKILLNPVLSLGLVVMLLVESISGALGYVIGRIATK